MARVPRDIETKFRKELGNVNPYMSVIDIAAKELLDKYTISEIEQLSKKYKHSRLSVGHLDLSKIPVFIHVSQMAFINSRAEQFCDEVLEFHKDNDTSPPNFDNLDKLDKFRRLIYRIASSNGTKVVIKKDNPIYAEYVGSIELKIADYYRVIRNTEFHGGIGESNSHLQLSDADLQEIKVSYKHKPNKFNDLTSRDVILYSQAWQKIAVNLCRKLIDLDSVVKKLCVEYSKCTAERRDNAISNKLRQDYLQSDDSINRLRNKTNGWIA